MEYIAQAIKLHSENPWSVCRVMLRLKYQSVGVLCKCPFGAYLCPKVGNVVRKNYALQQRISSATSLVDKFHPAIWGSQEIWLQLTKFFALQPIYPCHLPNRTLWCLFSQTRRLRHRRSGVGLRHPPPPKTATSIPAARYRWPRRRRRWRRFPLLRYNKVSTWLQIQSAIRLSNFPSNSFNLSPRILREIA